MGRYFAAMIMTSCLMTVGLGGCSPPVDTAIRSTGPGIQGTPSLMWATRADPQTGETPPQDVTDRARGIVAASLRDRGFSFAGDAPVTLAIGVAQRPGRIALMGESGARLSAAQGQKGIRRCRKDQLTRLGISMTDSRTGQILYHGSAQETHCRATLDQLLPHLVESALADMAAPKGERMIVSPVPN